jgi:L-fucose mutarotase
LTSALLKAQFFFALLQMKNIWIPYGDQENDQESPSGQSSDCVEEIRTTGGNMLKAIDPALNADVLFALRAMGHGDRLVVCDTNFPADSIARRTALGRLLRIDNVSAARAVGAILSVLPLDTFVEDAAIRMEIVGSPLDVPPVQQEVQVAIDRAEGKSWPLVGVERHAFYEKAKTAYCIVATGERRFYGCFLFTKGVIPPDERR